jgi:hypothetical protein
MLPDFAEALRAGRSVPDPNDVDPIGESRFWSEALNAGAVDGPGRDCCIRYDTRGIVLEVP